MKKLGSQITVDKKVEKVLLWPILTDQFVWLLPQEYLLLFLNNDTHRSHMCGYVCVWRENEVNSLAFVLHY